MRFRLLISIALMSLAGIAGADATLPKADIAGAKDSPLVGRFAGSFIVSYERKDFDELTLPLSALKPVADKHDGSNNVLHEPQQKKTLEGAHTRLVYLLPAGVAPLQAVRNYQNELTAQGAKTLFECKDAECGGDPGRASEGGGGNMSVAMYLWPEKRVKDKAFSNGNCAQTARIADQRYAVVEQPKANAHFSILAYQIKNDLYCKAFNDRTVVVLDIAETKAMEQKMVVVKAEEMAQSLNANGRVALYGLYFDTAKADVKPESRDTLVQIARLLTTAPALKLLVVGHTDNVGDFAGNMDLSRRRADAVIAVLTSQYKIDRKRLTPVGVSFASPVATNASDDGRAKNRRVELVPNN